MLPWLTRCFGSMQRPHAAAREAASSGSKHHGFAVVQLFGTALADLMRDASKRNDLDAWVAAAEAWSAVLLDAHRHDLCRAPGRAVSVFLLSLLPELLLQQGRFPSARAAAAAGSVLRALLEVDVHLLEERLSDVWSVLMHGAALAQADCVCAARDLVIAYGETRLLPKVLVAATTALCVGRTRNTPEVGALLCAPELGAAWAAAAEKLPAMQCPELISCVRDCLAHADAAGAFAPGSMLDCVIASLAEMLSATLSGVVATPEASAALASAAVELQVFAKSLLDKLLPSKGVKLVSAGGVALCLRICTCVASLVHACAACTSDIAVPLPVPEQCDAILRDCLERLAPWLASEKRRAAPWCELEAARAALLLRTWEDRCGTTSSRAYVAHLARLPLALDAVKRGVWDGMFSTVTVETLPCAFWQLVTEHMATWCAGRLKHFRLERATHIAGSQVRECAGRVLGGRFGLFDKNGSRFRRPHGDGHHCSCVQPAAAQRCFVLRAAERSRRASERFAGRVTWGAGARHCGCQGWAVRRLLRADGDRGPAAMHRNCACARGCGTVRGSHGRLGCE